MVLERAMNVIIVELEILVKSYCHSLFKNDDYCLNQKYFIIVIVDLKYYIYTVKFSTNCAYALASSEIK